MQVKRLIVSIALALSAASSACAAQVEDEKQAVTRLENEWREARIHGDTAFLERFYAEEFRVQTMNGDVQSRAKDIDLFAYGVLKPKFIDHGPLDITIYGNTAVVTGLDHLGGTYAGHYGEFWLRFTDVLVKRGHRWQLVVQQATPSKEGS